MANYSLYNMYMNVFLQKMVTCKLSIMELLDDINLSLGRKIINLICLIFILNRDWVRRWIDFFILIFLFCLCKNMDAMYSFLSLLLHLLIDIRYHKYGSFDYLSKMMWIFLLLTALALILKDLQYLSFDYY